MATYQSDVLAIIKYTTHGSDFERDAILEVSRDHGEDPATVKRDVLALRRVDQPGVFSDWQPVPVDCSCCGAPMTMIRAALQRGKQPVCPPCSWEKRQ